MTSILTNAGALSALQTLRFIESNMQKTQGQVSSGLRVQVAADNAAYWSISTTMRSDRMAVSAVSDALGLGAAQVDVAYHGMESVIEILSEFKAKLVTAKEDGVDKAKIQTELDQLKEQVVSVSTSASFSGQNWLTTEFEDIYDSKVAKSSVVSSFVRTADGSVAVNTTTVDLAKVALFNSTGGGILQADPRDMYTIGGLRYLLNGDASGAIPYSTSSAGNAWGFGPSDFRFDFSSPMVFGAGDQISFDVVVDADNSLDGIPPPYNVGAATNNVVIDMNAVNSALNRSDGTINTYKEYAAVLSHVLGGTGVSATTYWKYDPPNQTRIRVDIPDVVGVVHLGLPTMDGSSMEIRNVSASGVSLSNQLADTGTRWGTRRSEMNLSFSPFKVYDGVTVTLDFIDHRQTVGHLTFDKQYVDTVLGVDNGTVSTSADMATLLNSLVDRTDVIIQDTGAGTVTVKTDVMVDRKSGEKSSVGFSNIKVNIEPIPTQNFLDIDIVAQPGGLSSYIAYIETVQQRAIDGAAVLGALQSRIGMQAEFAAKMMANIDAGIGRLVDADMDEASTRLKAIQTQQQLAIQSLSIANTSAEQVVQLFR